MIWRLWSGPDSDDVRVRWPFNWCWKFIAMQKKTRATLWPRVHKMFDLIWRNTAATIVTPLRTCPKDEVMCPVRGNCAERRAPLHGAKFNSKLPTRLVLDSPRHWLSNETAVLLETPPCGRIESALGCYSLPFQIPTLRNVKATPTSSFLPEETSGRRQDAWVFFKVTCFSVSERFVVWLTISSPLWGTAFAVTASHSLPYRCLYGSTNEQHSSLWRGELRFVQPLSALRADVFDYVLCRVPFLFFTKL